MPSARHGEKSQNPVRASRTKQELTMYDEKKGKSEEDKQGKARRGETTCCVPPTCMFGLMMTPKTIKIQAVSKSTMLKAANEG